MLSENLIREYAGAWTIVRPSWTYGPRDRIVFNRLAPALRAGKVRIIGPGDNLLNVIFGADVAAGAILAAENAASVGEVYNLSSHGEVTQRKLLDSLTAEFGLPPITKQVPFRMARNLAFLQELWAKMTFSKMPPTITRRAIYLVGRPPLFSTEKARQRLGWQPKVKIEEGVRRTLEWLFAEEQRIAAANGKTWSKERGVH
jgi:nucleoside-diphosphate-sugar epimerase